MGLAHLFVLIKAWIGLIGLQIKEAPYLALGYYFCIRDEMSIDVQ